MPNDWFLQEIAINCITQGMVRHGEARCGEDFITLKSNTMSKKVMRLLDQSTGEMECKVCGQIHFARLQSGLERADGITRYYRGSWQCIHGCRLD